ncbi:MAG: hypothetical protein J2P18_09745 [Nocardia sp.]|nr:hypothetical protein [Nocardia sp.]
MPDKAAGGGGKSSDFRPWPPGLVDSGVINPEALYEYYSAGVFGDDTELLAAAVSESWKGETLTTDIGHREWCEMFRAARPALRHPEPPGPLYRGCHPEHKRGMSWSNDQATARMYQKYHSGRTGRGGLYVTPMVDRREVLAYYPGKREFVLDPDRLVITQVDLIEAWDTKPPRSVWGRGFRTTPVSLSEAVTRRNATPRPR